MAFVANNPHLKSDYVPVSDPEAKELDRPSIPQPVTYGPHSLPSVVDSSPRRSSIRRSVSEDAIVSTKWHTSHGLSPNYNTEASSGNKLRLGPESSESKPKIAISKFTISERSNKEATSGKDIGDISSPARQERKVRPVSNSLSSFTKPWDTTSRSVSPGKTQAGSEKVSHSSAIDSGGSSTATSPTKTSPNSKLPRRPLSAFLRRSSSKVGLSAETPIPKSFSSDRLPSVLHGHYPSNLPSAAPNVTSSDRTYNKGIELPRKKDELWSMFRNLDADFQRFQSRSIASRTGFIRSDIIPFLRNYADHPSSVCLRLDDLDRRVNLLNRWWTGILEMLNGKNGESVSGNDRAIVLEAITAIMIRPEWDSATQPSSTRSENSSRLVLKSRSTTSLASTESEFFAESILHHIRNTFSQNLLAQMAFVIEKMSARNVAASVVTFCGKAAAYAFFYCDGVAEILVRLWELKSEALRRILAEYNVQKLQTPSEKTLNCYPSCLHALAFRSLPQTMRYLRSQPQLPIATAYIPWHGPWVRRWAGRDTDLFFAFTKMFHNLMCRLFPDNHCDEELVSAPGYILVQAQVLAVLDANLQYDSNQDRLKGRSLTTFDDILEEPDAAATPLPHPVSNSIRSMAENRIIILLRDSLSRAPSVNEKGRRIFAKFFEKTLKAAARRTSLFNHNACYILCDFMEETIALLSRYYQASDPMFADVEWPFWLDVLRRMGKSQNTMTEIRLFAFLYSLWGTITNDETRKREICLDWLLDKEFFESQFNHWCPMVRAYFMRLLCWRVARCDMKETVLDGKILETLSARLGGVWGIFLHLKESSRTCHKLAPSTAPSRPAPGRCLLIVRDDIQSATTGMFLSFDSILSEPSRTQATAFERYGSLNSAAQTNPLTHPDHLNSGEKKRWSSLRNIMPFAVSLGDRRRVPLNRSNSSDDRELRPLSTTQQPEQGKHTRTDYDDKSVETSSVEAMKNRPEISYNSHSFKFSLEWSERRNSTMEEDRSLDPPKLPITAQILLRPAEESRPEYSLCIPKGEAVKLSKYTGRALSEWDIVVSECQHFFERRRKEGVPTNHKVETPSLGVELFKQYT